MKQVPLIAGAIGLVLVLVAVLGRFAGPPVIVLAGHTFVAGTFLTLANTMFLVGILAHLLASTGK